MASAITPTEYVRQGSRNPAQPRPVNVQVAVRCRPLNSRERAAGERAVLKCDENAREVVCSSTSGPPTVPANAGQKTYTYDHVFGPEASQADLYHGVVEAIVDEVLQGYNCTVFAYGQTGTGKTHTMEGRRDDDVLGMAERRLPENAGIIPRSVKQIFDHLRSITDEHSVRVSHLELYNEQLTDLLGPDTEEAALPDSGLRVYDDVSKGTFVQGLDEVLVRSEEEIFAVLDKSASKRRTAETLMNKYSSRSHSVFTIHIHIKESAPDGADLLKVGKLNLVDLAGSENVGRSGAVRGRAREAGNINQSLLTLGRVITALVEKHPHVPYRDSKLTRLLQESLGGRNKTCVIATVTPASSSIEETASTLDYAHRAKSIKNRPTVNQMIAKNVLLKEYTEEIAKIRRELDASRTKNGVYLPPEEFERLQATSKHQKEWISQLEGRTDEFEKQNGALKEKLGRTQDALFRTFHDLESTRGTLQRTESKLEETTHNLMLTTRQRNEANHLVRNHVDCEQKLLTEGQDLTISLGTAMKDVDALHSRVSARIAAEKANVERLSSVQAAVATNLEKADLSIEEFRESQKSHLEKSRVLSTVMVEHVSRAVTEVVESLEAVNTELRNVRSSHESRELESDEEMRVYEAAKYKELGDHAAKRRRLSSTAEDTLRDAHANLRQLIEGVAKGLERIKETCQASFAAHGSHLDAFATAQGALLAKAKIDFEERLEVQKGVLSVGESSIKDAVQIQQARIREGKESAIYEITRILSKLVESADSSAETVLEESRHHATSLRESADKMQQEFVLMSTKHCELVSDVQLRATSDIREANGDIETAVNEVISSSKADVETSQRQTTEMEGALTSMGAIHVEEQQLLHSLIKDINENREARHARSEAAMAEQSRTLSDATASMTGCLSTSNAELASDVTKLHEQLSGVNADNKAFTKLLSRSLQSEVKSVVDDMDLATDENASLAPPKRQWVYPTSLTRTPAHETLVADFRTEQGYGETSDDGQAASEQPTAEAMEQDPKEDEEKASAEDSGASQESEPAPQPPRSRPETRAPSETRAPAETRAPPPTEGVAGGEEVLRDRTNIPSVTLRRGPGSKAGGAPGAEPGVKKSGLRPLTRRPKRVTRRNAN